MQTTRDSNISWRLACSYNILSPTPLPQSDSIGFHLLSQSLNHPVDLLSLICCYIGLLSLLQYSIAEEERISSSTIFLHENRHASAIVEDHIEVSSYRKCWYFYYTKDGTRRRQEVIVLCICEFIEKIEIFIPYLEEEILIRWERLAGIIESTPAHYLHTSELPSGFGGCELHCFTDLETIQAKCTRYGE